MLKREIIKGLEQHNKWRRGAEIEMMDPTYLSKIIDGAVKLLKRSQNNKKKESAND